ncbi:Hsp70 protein that interacts with Zuo1p [Microbotryomycetes sp. JL221]|nr:Hsp70 protein that interacts with Zuo1p [Microbotryomycetes sp. JL221]
MAPKKGQKGSKKSTANNSRVASGAATPASREAPEPIKDTRPAACGINFGQSFSSVAVINKEGLADCIANDDGERQIATALSFSGTEEYSGVPARTQLVRNPANTILGFRNLLGKTYDEVKSVKQPHNSAPIVDHNGQPAFTVEVDGKPLTLTAHECAVRYLKVLLSYATDFIGRDITTAVLAVPSDFNQQQTDALVKAAEEAQIKVAQTVSEVSSALIAYAQTPVTDNDASSSIDRNTVVLDVGGTSTTVSVVAVRDGLFVPLSTVTDATLGGDLFDDKLMDWFSKEFTKKTKVTVESSNHRAQMKLKLAVEQTKKSLSASTSAPCSIESLADGMDFHGSVNRTRFDLLSSAVYGRIVEKVGQAVEQAKLDALQIHEVVLVGGAAKMPSLANRLFDLFDEDITSVSNRIEPDEVIARGLALQAQSLLSEDNLDLVNRVKQDSGVLTPSTIVRPIGLVNGDEFSTLIEAESPLPVRRIVEFSAAKGIKQVLLSFAEGEQYVDVQQPEPKAANGHAQANKGDDDDEFSDDEPEETKTVKTKPVNKLTDVVFEVDESSKNKIRLSIVVLQSGKGQIKVSQGSKVVEGSF